MKKKKEKKKTLVCTNLKQTSAKCVVVLFDIKGNAGKNIDEFICLPRFYQ